MNNFSLSCLSCLVCLSEISVNRNFRFRRRAIRPTFVSPLQTATKQKVPFASNLLALKSQKKDKKKKLRPVGVVKAGSCPGCPGPSRRSWCPSPSRPRCARPPPGSSLVSACGWRRGEQADPGSRSGRAFRQMDPGLGSRRGGRGRMREDDVLNMQI